jgi:predicted nucleic acid-binding protein
MVAAVCSWHENHRAAADELERRLAAGDVMVIAGPALVETYAVLTRLPAPYRLAPVDAHALVVANFLDATEIETLDAVAYRAMLDAAPGQRVAGGQIYDAVIATCARRARVAALLTLNARHFRALEQDFEVVTPADSRG